MTTQPINRICSMYIFHAYTRTPPSARTHHVPHMPPKAPHKRTRPTSDPTKSPNRLIPRNRRTPTEAPLIAPPHVDLRDFIRRRGGPNGKRQTTITLLAGRPTTAGHALIGVSVRTQGRHLYYHHPVTSLLDRDLPHALETAVLRAPAMTDLIITTPIKSLWDLHHLTPATKDRIADLGCRVRFAHPLQHDLGTALAKTASEGHTGPQHVDAHLYTATLTDGHRTYTAAVLWQHGHVLQTTLTTDPIALDLAEVRLVLWAAGRLPAGASLQIQNANPTLTRLWSNPEHMTPEQRQALTPLLPHLTTKGLQIRQGSDPINRRIARATRDIAATLYASADLTPEEHA